MCGRFSLYTLVEMLIDVFDLSPVVLDVQPRYNIAPTQPVAVLTNDRPRELQHHRWGLIPPWAKDPSAGAKMINARGESLAEKPSFRSPYRSRRCLILADGFYEWRKEGRTRTPHYFQLRSAQPFAMAGLWEEWKDPEGSVVPSCAIITTEANETVRPVHHRMPVILPQHAHEAWLDPAPQSPLDLDSLLLPYPALKMSSTQVSPRVNSVANDDPDCIRPQVQQGLFD